jgi:hypothetical protein
VDEEEEQRNPKRKRNETRKDLAVLFVVGWCSERKKKKLSRRCYCVRARLGFKPIPRQPPRATIPKRAAKNSPKISGCDWIIRRKHMSTRLSIKLTTHLGVEILIPSCSLPTPGSSPVLAPRGIIFCLAQNCFFAFDGRRRTSLACLNSIINLFSLGREF